MTPTSVSPKVATGTTAGALVVLIIAILSGCGIDASPEVASALTVLVSALVGWATPDHLRSLGARVQARDYDPKHDGCSSSAAANPVDGIGPETEPASFEVIPAEEATSDTKSDAAGL